MTVGSPVLDFGGTGSVLVIWSLLVVLIGAGLFIYGIGVSVRDRRGSRGRKRRRSSPPAGRRPSATTRTGPYEQPPRAARPLALPAGPSAGTGYAGGSSAYGSRPLALPAGPSAYAQPSAGYPPAPSHQAPSHQAPSHQAPSHQAPSYQTPARQASPYQPQPYTAAPPAMPPSAPPPTWPPPAAPAAQPTIAAPIAPPPTWPAPATAASATSSAVYTSAGGGRPTVLDAEPGAGFPEVISAPPAGYGPTGYGRAEGPGGREQRPTRKPRRDDCAELRAECVRLREQADGTIAAAAQAVTEAEEAHTRYVEAQKATEEATRAYEAAATASAAVATELQRFERAPTDDQRRLEQETTHAAFAAYRRGDISSDQLREVFRRAEGWTPEQDQLSRDVLTRRVEEAEAMRVRDAAVAAEQAAGEQARIAAISARALDEEASAAIDEARRLCARAAECGKRRR